MYRQILAEMASKTWAVDHRWLASIAGKLEAGHTVAVHSRRPSVSQSVAVIPIHGPITQRGFMGGMFGGTSTQDLLSAFHRAVGSDRVKSIVFDIDSPGGTVDGVEEAADAIFGSRGSKPIVAVANSQAASAAYWIGSQADKFVAAPGAEAGSIGVFRMHQDISASMANEGVKVTFIRTPKFKVEANPFEPLSEEAAAHHQEQVDATYDAFNSAVARGRGLSAKDARTNFGEGRSFDARQAQKMGMVDSVATMSQTLRSFGVGSGIGLSQADADLTAILCEDYGLAAPEARSSRKSKDVLRRKIRLTERRVGL